MKRFNSVFTFALSIDHWKEDASDITKEEVREAILLRLSDVMNDDPPETLVTGPDDTEDMLRVIHVPDFGMVVVPHSAELGLLPDEDVSFPIGEHLRMTISYNAEKDRLHWKLTPAFADDCTLKSGKL